MLGTEFESVNSYPLSSSLASAGLTAVSDFGNYLDPLQMPTSAGNHLVNPKTIAFFDSTVSDISTVTSNLDADIKVILDPTRDGIAQITEVLSHYDGLTGVEIISHGSTAALQLGNSFLSQTSLQQYAPALQQWSSSLTSNADILLYGCNIASDEFGQAFVNNLSALTGVDIAASTNLTGSAAKGGNWTLEYTTGSIETAVPFDESLISTYQGLLPTLFTTQTPVLTNVTDGSGSAGDYELGMEFTSTKAGQIDAIRYYKAPSETGPHEGKIWSSNGTLLASVTFTNETASGWQQQALTTPLTIQPNTTYVVSVNVNSYYVATNNGIASTLTNGDISAIADGSNGVYNDSPGLFPTQSWQNSNYFRDIVFTPTVANPNNNPGSVAVNGTPTQNQTLTANVADTDGLTGVTINYQWQQFVSGNWTNIVGATSQTLNLTQAQVGNQVRATATYTDTLGTSENVISTPTSAVANVNDLGVVAISGTTIVGNTLTTTVADPDGLTGVTVAYQWQRSSNNGQTWTNVTGATSQTLSLDSSLVGQQTRVNAIYTDTLGGSENIFSSATAAITNTPSTQTLFTTQTPVLTNVTDGSGSAGDYELGMEFTSTKAGQIDAIRYYKAPSETGPHEGKIWSSNGTLLASVTFTNETASGWQQQALTTPLTIQPNTTYVVSVNVNSYYVATNNGIASTLTNGDISAIADGSNGVYNDSPGLFPTQSWQNSNYFRDIVFTPTVANPNNNPGSVAVNGTPTQNQTLTANVADTDGLTGVTINYQWQQFVSGNWTNIVGATSQTLNLTQAQVGNQVRATATYTDVLGTNENVISASTTAVSNVNDVGLSILAGSAANGGTLQANVLDADGLTGISIDYQWQQFVNNVWTNITGATSKIFALGSSFVGSQVRAVVNYIDTLGSGENISSSPITVTAQNAIVVENQKAGTTAWKIPSTSQATTEIEGFADATSINKGQAINLKISLAQAGRYQIDVYRLGYYGGAGGRQVIPSIIGLSGGKQAGSTINPNTRLVEYNWNTSYTLQTDASWTSGLYFVKLTDSGTGKQNYIQFTVRDDNRPADLGFQDAIATAQAYNNYGGYSVYDFNSNGGQRAYQVSFDRPFQYNTSAAAEQFNNTLTWEYNMTRWLESQGYDVSYYTNLDVSINPLQLYSQKTFLSIGHDEYWSGDQRNNVEKARDNGTNLAFFSANTAYWQVRYEPSTSGVPNRVMTVYKDSSGIGTGLSLDPIAQTNPTAATTLFRSSEVNRPENALLGVGYIGDWGSNNVYNGADFVVSNASDPYYANTGLKNGDKLIGLVGYEWDGLLNNGLTPLGLTVLSQSPVSPSGGLPPLPPGTNTNIAHSVRYTAASGAKVFSTGSVQWVWGLDSDGVINPRVDSRAQQIAVNIFTDMGSKPQTPNGGIIIPS
jgi:Domain of unknown function (DUF4347)/Domain of unknown function (DUF4082)